MLLQLALRVDNKTTVVLLILTMAEAFGNVTVAVCLRWTVDEAVTGRLTAVLATATFTAVSFAALTTANRVVWALQVDLGQQVDLEIRRDVITSCTSLANLAHVERTEYLDRIELLLRSSWTMVRAWMYAAEAGMVLVGMLISASLLAEVDPALLGLPVAVVPLLLFTGKGQSLVGKAMLASAEGERVEQHLLDVCIQPSSAKEVKAARSGPELARIADEQWREVTRIRCTAHWKAALFNVAGWLVFATGYGGALMLVTWRVVKGQSSVGDLLLAITLALRLQFQIEQTARSIASATDGFQGMDHYLWLKDYEVSQMVDGDSPRRTGLLKASGCATSHSHIPTPSESCCMMSTLTCGPTA